MIINVSSFDLVTKGGFMNTIGKGKVHAFLWIFVCLSLLCLTASNVFAQIVNPLVGKWGYTMLGKGQSQKWFGWKTEAGTFTFNSNGTGSNQFAESADVCPDANYCNPSDDVNFTYTANQNQDGTYTLTLNFGGKIRSLIVALSDNNTVFIADGTADTNAEMMFVGVKMDTQKTYTNADINGDYYMGGYEYDALGYQTGKGTYKLESTTVNYNNGSVLRSKTLNVDGTIIQVSGQSGETYNVDEYGSISNSDRAKTGYAGNGKVAVGSKTQGGQATDFKSSIALKKADRSYTQADLQGTWAYAGFGDYQGTTFRSEFGTVTCDQNGSCTISMKRKGSDDGTTSNFSTSVNLTASSDGALNGFLLTNATPHFSGAIGNDGKTMLLVMNTSNQNTNDRALGVAVKCSACSSPSGATISFTGKVEDVNNNPVSGATISVVGGIPSITVSSDASGNFTLTGLPSGTVFWLKVNKSGYLNTYSGDYNETEDINQIGGFTLLTDSEFGLLYSASWVHQRDLNKGVIHSRVYAEISPKIGYVNGVQLTATGAGKTYPVTYFDDNGPITGATSTDTSGRFIVLNVDNGDTVTITGTKTNWTGFQRTYKTYANSLSDGRIIGTTTSTISFTGNVQNGTTIATTPLQGATVALYGNSNIKTTTDSSGNFTLGGLPPDTTFELIMTKIGYIPTYSSNLNFNTSYTSRSYTLLPQSVITGWGVQPNKGVITARVVDNTNPQTGYIEGAIVTYTSSKYPSSQPYTVKYRDDAGTFTTGGSTFSNGKYYIFDVEEGDTVKVTATKPGWDFTQKNPKIFVTHANATSQNSIYGTLPVMPVVNLSAGWNFVSFPKVPQQGNSTAEVLKDVSSNVRVVWGFDNATQGWLKYGGQGSAVSGQGTLVTIETGKGYWIYMNATGTIDMANWAVPPSTTAITLYPGWNLVGYNGASAAIPDPALNSISSTYVIVWNWNNAEWFAHRADGLTIPVSDLMTVEQKKAYWIKTNLTEGQTASWGQ